MERRDFFKTLGAGAAVMAVPGALFSSVSGLSDDEILPFAAAGKGKAEGGVCGALHAARLLLQEPTILRQLEDEFEAAAGSLQCKQIRRARKLPCGDCVALIARCLQRHMEFVAPPRDLSDG